MAFGSSNRQHIAKEGATNYLSRILIIFPVHIIPESSMNLKVAPKAIYTSKIT
jgi:hypothetical protein